MINCSMGVLASGRVLLDSRQGGPCRGFLLILHVAAACEESGWQFRCGARCELP